MGGGRGWTPGGEMGGRAELHRGSGLGRWPAAAAATRARIMCCEVPGTLTTLEAWCLGLEQRPVAQTELPQSLQ